jgi:hypothetical protein
MALVASPLAKLIALAITWCDQARRLDLTSLANATGCDADRSLNATPNYNDVGDPNRRTPGVHRCGRNKTQQNAAIRSKSKRHEIASRSFSATAESGL